MALTQEITHTCMTLTIKFNNSMFVNQTLTLNLEGKTHILDVNKLGKVAFRSYWDINGSTLVTIMKSTAPDSQKTMWTSCRYFQDWGRILIVDHLVKLSDGRKLTGRGFFENRDLFRFFLYG